MGLDLGKLLRNVGTLGTTWMRDQRQAKKKKKKAGQLVEENTALAEQMMNRDLGQTAFAGVQADPAMIAAQQRALGQTEQVAREGYTDVDRAAMNQQLNDVARYEQSQRASLAADARARGVTGSGVDIASQLAAQQSGADRAMQTGTDMALAGRDRSYRANQDAGALAGQMRGQGFGEQAQVAGATDQYGQWRVGQQSADAGMLMNARLGQAQSMQAAAAEQAGSPNLDAAANAVANYYTAGQAGNVAGSGGGGSYASGSYGSGTPGGGATPWIAGSPGGPSASTHTTTTYGANRVAAPAGRTTAAGGIGGPPPLGGTARIAQAANVPAPPNMGRTAPGQGGNARRAARPLMRQQPRQAPAPTQTVNPYRRGGIRG